MSTALQILAVKQAMARRGRLRSTTDALRVVRESRHYDAAKSAYDDWRSNHDPLPREWRDLSTHERAEWCVAAEEVVP